ncbi:Holliday junction resolvase RuvX [Tenuibacillus multivorans]|uniref:Putative pre-16S rRNA nuclease n=1 Tax=Tenuibacillus multivorans TaxID=237069 RepID=A0A1G9ZHV9_9BACI|nr:Holliday junction resolvase RuvX [Tenuibacillus multivorans]GEL77499.1 putative pre-16S rRNA nuclease [Tenuibacillus multivorans]SDN20775.1 putative holliday junction resolvase [Tenuibacillus multivorans]
MKILGLDVGEKTIGVAVSDALHFTAQGIETIKWDESDYRTALPRLKEIIGEHDISKIVVGLPKNMNGTEGERANSSREFASHMEHEYELPVVLWDERLTTMAAERVLLEADMSRKKRKKVIDKMAAVMILQSYLDAGH